MKKIIWIGVAVVVIAVGVWVWVHYFFVFARGMKSGTLNYVTEKGYVFKTYEGEMILAGFQTKGQSSMQSNEFLFSIQDPVLARKLMVNAGKVMLLHYKEYKGAVAWRGYSKFIVDSLVSIDSPDAPVK